MRIFIIYFLLFALSTVASDMCSGQSWYWIGFTDKAGTAFSLSKPLEFLSERSLQRRERQNIPLDDTDLPVSRVYVDSVLKSGAELVHSSRWLNGITVRAVHDSLAGSWKEFSFIREVQLTKPSGTILKSAVEKFSVPTENPWIDSSFYGAAVHQIGQLNGQFLHKQGFQGEDIVIAILDAGFYRAGEIPSLSHLARNGSILGTRDFVSPGQDVFLEHAHGMMVLSAMGGHQPGYLVGTSPKASYWLIRTEDATSEYLIEEDNWVAGAELADSAGADIINSSLGYSEFDDPAMNHTYSDMDGETTRVTQGANMAARKGMMVFASAGNEARSRWRYILAPADGKNVIAVGAVDKNRNYADRFSSVGPSFSGDIKPNLAAMGSGTAVSNATGAVVAANGTSFSSPVLAGMSACLWQSAPHVSAAEITRVLMLSGHLAQQPDTLLGYGIPDFYLAHLILSRSNVPLTGTSPRWTLFPNPFLTEITVYSAAGIQEEILLEVAGLSGAIIMREKMAGSSHFRTGRLAHLPGGIYLVRISGRNSSETHRLVKLR